MEKENENNDLIFKKKIGNHLFNKYSNSFSKHKNNVDVINLDPFKYNPNYNSIYKNIPSIKFIPTKSKDNLNSKKWKNKYIINRNKLFNNKKPLVIKDNNNNDHTNDNNNIIDDKNIDNVKLLTNTDRLIFKYNNKKIL